MSVRGLQRAATTAAWLSAALRGAIGVEHALDVIEAEGGAADVVLTDDPDPLPLAFAIARWRGLGVVGWQYVPVAAGDAAGLPGPVTFSGAALEVGVGLVAAGPAGWGLTPGHVGDTEVWCEQPVAAPARLHLLTPADAERALLRALNASVDLLDDQVLTSWQQDPDNLRSAWDERTPMPPGTDERSERLALRSRRILDVLQIALADDGGSRTAADVNLRRTSLAELHRAARHAHAAAWNTGLQRSAGAR